MSNKKILIIGGVAGGATTAARLRRVDEHAHIIMFDKGGYISYANCGLPYYIGGVIEERQALLVQTPEIFYSKFNIDVRIKSEVIDIDSEKQEVTVKKIESGEIYTVKYDQLVLSPGAKPIIPPIPGIKNSNIFIMRNVEDTDKIKNFIDANKPKSAAVIGAGFIGLEMAENLKNSGLKVNVIEASSQILNVLDSDMASILHQHFKQKDVGLYLSDKVVAFEHKDGLTSQIKLESGKVIDSDIIILSIGVRPNNTLAEKTKLKLGKTGGIVVDEFFQTSKANIYAVGDCIEYAHPIFGMPIITYLAGPANKQARMLADNLTFGHQKSYKGAFGTAIAKIFDLSAAVTGATDKFLESEGIDYISTIIEGGSNAEYYPGSKSMNIKISFCPVSGKLYGGQIVGHKSVDKRIDMLAITLQHSGTIFDLQEIEHAYAPPFNSAKDLVNQIGFTAENIMRGFFKPITAEQVASRDLEKTILVDVRKPEEFKNETIDGAINIPLGVLRKKLDKLDKSKDIYLFCIMGMRGYIATRILKQNGFENVYNLSGGIALYKSIVAEQSNQI